MEVLEWLGHGFIFISSSDLSRIKLVMTSSDTSEKGTKVFSLLRSYLRCLEGASYHMNQAQVTFYVRQEEQ